jgi:hypothetical protein
MGAFHVTSCGLRLCVTHQPHTFDRQADAAAALDDDPSPLDSVVNG